MSDFSYTEALADVEAILDRLGRQPCDVDTLASETARAMDLLARCRARLLVAETTVNEIVEGK